MSKYRKHLVSFARGRAYTKVGAGVGQAKPVHLCVTRRQHHLLAAGCRSPLRPVQHGERRYMQDPTSREHAHTRA